MTAMMKDEKNTVTASADLSTFKQKIAKSYFLNGPSLASFY